MSVDADLALDIRQALTAVAQVEQAISNATQSRVVVDTSGVAPSISAAVDAADSTVIVTGDAAELTGDVTAAVDAGDSQVTVTGDAAEVTGSINGAVEAADSTVEVTAEAAEVTGSIDAAVQAADTHVTIEADAQGLQETSEAASQTAVGLAAASTQAGFLREHLGAIGAAGAATALFKAAQAASDLGESTSKATVVFGQGIDEVEAFADASDTSLGLAKQDALEITGTFGNLLTALGLTKEEATKLSPEIVTLGADLASFNNLEVDETLEKLRSGLVGEVEPLRSLGVSFNAAQVEAKAMELGLADANGEISEGAKVQARWALIVDQSANAQGDFARTSSGLANQQRILSAEFRNAVTALGAELLPALLEGVQIARSDLIPAFERIGSDVLPSVAKAFVSLLPVAGSFANILVAMAPVITAVADGIASLPPELITLVGLLVAVNRVGGGKFLTGIRERFSELADPAKGPGGFSKSLKASVGDMIAANAASFGLSLGVAAIGLAFQENAEKAAKFDRAVKTIQATLATAGKEGDSASDAFAQVFTTLVDEGGSVAGILNKLGINAEEFGQLVSKGGDLTDIFARRIGTSADELGILSGGFEDFAKQIQQASKAQVESIRASGNLSDKTIEAAEARHTENVETAAGTVAVVDYVAVLTELNAAQQEEARAIGTTVDETGKLVEATGLAGQAADVLALSLAQVTDGSGNVNAELTGLALAAGNARVAEEDMQDVADQLGVSLDDLKTFVSNVNDAVNTFADNTLETLPGVGDIIGDLGDDFSPRALLDKLTQATEDIADFQTNIEALAAFPRVQQIAATNGPAVAAALAQPVKDGNTQVIEDLEAQAGAFDLHYAGLDADLRERIGPQIAEATGLTATLATDAFGANFDPQSKADEATHQTIASIEGEAANATSAGFTLGDSATGGFSTGAGGMPTAAVTASEGSVNAVLAKSQAARIAGALFGGAASGGTSTGLSAMPGAAAAAANRAIGEISLREALARAAGKSLGGAMADGVSAGINAAAEAVAAAAGALVDAAIARAREKAKSKSPSLLFAELGRDLADGVTMGLEAGAAGVSDAAAGLITMAQVASADTLGVDVRRFDTGGGPPGSPVVINAVEGMLQVTVVGTQDTAAAIATGRNVARGFMGFVQEQEVRTIARSQV